LLQFFYSEECKNNCSSSSRIYHYACRSRRGLFGEARGVRSFLAKPPLNQRDFFGHGGPRRAIRRDNGPDASPEASGAIADDAPEKTGSGTATDRGKIRGEEAEVHREQRAVPRGTEEGLSIFSQSCSEVSECCVQHCKPAVDEDAFQKMVERQYDMLKKERMKNLEEQKPKPEENGTVGEGAPNVQPEQSPTPQDGGQPQSEVL
jgi:hypothetical protein